MRQIGWRRLLLLMLAVSFLSLVPGTVSAETASYRPEFNGRGVDTTSITTQEGGDTAQFTIGAPTIPKQTDRLRVIVAPDTQSDIGSGAGVAKVFDVSYAQNEWVFAEIGPDGNTLTDTYGGHFVDVRAVDDDQVEGTHESVIEVGISCAYDMSNYPKFKSKLVVTNTISDNDSPGDVHGEPSAVKPSDPGCMNENPKIAATSKPSSPSQAAPQQEAGAPMWPYLVSAVTLVGIVGLIIVFRKQISNGWQAIVELVREMRYW